MLEACKDVNCTDSSVSLLFFGSDPEAARVSSSKITTTLGLVVHAAGTSPSVLSLLVWDSLVFPCSSRCVNLRFIITVIYLNNKTSYYHYNYTLYCTVKSTFCLQLTASHSELLPRRLRPAFSSLSLLPSCCIRYGSFSESAFFSRKAAGCKHVETGSLQYLTTNPSFCMADISKLLFALVWRVWRRGKAIFVAHEPQRIK